MACTLANSSDFGLLGEQSSQKVDSRPWTLTNRRAKCDAARFILCGEIRNRTNTQAVNDISTPCLSACVDKKQCYCSWVSSCTM